MHDDLGSQATGPSDFKIGDWWVRPRQNELERLGETVSVEGRSMAVLVALARHAPGIVSKERLISEVWSDSPHVSDDVITHAIWELRKALGDSGKKKQYIRTVARKGYGLVAEVLRPQGSPLPLEGARIDHYDLGREIGRGAMGVVFEAVDRRLDRKVAVKFLAGELTRDVKACQRFEREARLAASLDHPNLATVHEIGETSDGHRYLVLSLYSGGSLEDRLSQGPLPLEDAVLVVRQLLDGLSVAHDRDVVHRDIKPANLLLDAHGTLKLCDFGIAKLLGATDLTETGGAVGTPAYKSPEQALGRPVDHRTDLWSAAVVLFELLTGKRPLDGQGGPDGLKVLLRDAAVDAGQLEALERFFEKGLAEEVELRFQSAAEMSEALGRRTNAPPARPSFVSRRPAFWLGLAVLVVGLWLGDRYLHDSSETALRSDPEPASANLTEVTPPKVEASRQSLDLARTTWLRGQHEANLKLAQEQFEAAMKAWPESAEAKAHLAAFLADRSAERTFDVEQRARLQSRARKLAEEVLGDGTLSSGPIPALARTALSRLSYLNNDLQTAEEQARSAIAEDPSCRPGQSCDLAYLWLGEALWSQDRVDEAIDVLLEGAFQGGGHIRCNLKLAQLYERLGRLRESETVYVQVLAFDEAQSTALTGLGLLLFKTERYQEAAPFLQKAYFLTSEPSLIYNYGIAQYFRKYWAQARSSFETAQARFVEEGIKNPAALVGLGDIELELGNEELARDYFEQALLIFNQLNDSTLGRKAQRAVCLAKAGRIDEAKVIIDPMLEDTQLLVDVPSVLYYGARIYALAGDRVALLRLTKQGKIRQLPPTHFLDDPAFIPYRDDEEYLRIVDPDMFLDSE